MIATARAVERFLSAPRAIAESRLSRARRLRPVAAPCRARLATQTPHVAHFSAIAVTCDAIVKQLSDAYDPADFAGEQAQFEVFRTERFDKPLTSGVSLYLFRVSQNGQSRTPPSARREAGKLYRPQLPLDLHILLSAWGKSASVEHALLGWAMRVMEDRALLPASLLNAVRAGTFPDEESVECSLGHLTVEEMMRIWDTLPGRFQPSVPYVARVVRIESLLPPRNLRAVDTREFDFNTHAEATP